MRELQRFMMGEMGTMLRDMDLGAGLAGAARPRGAAGSRRARADACVSRQQARRGGGRLVGGAIEATGEHANERMVRAAPRAHELVERPPDGAGGPRGPRPPAGASCRLRGPSAPSRSRYAARGAARAARGRTEPRADAPRTNTRAMGAAAPLTNS